MGLLSGRVALITGASRGIGRGIAEVLGEHGATVYITGRTLEPGSHSLPGTLGETAAAVEARGGQCIPVAVDHADDQQVERLFDQIRAEQDGQLDLLVNNVMAIPDALTQKGSFWEKPLSTWEMMDVGLRSSFVAARLAAQLMVPRRRGLIVGLSGYVGVTYTYDVVFGTCKAAMDRMSRDMGIELKPHNVASVSLWQGFTYTERARKNLQTVDGMATDLNSAVGSSVEFPGRVIAALLDDPNVMARTGGTFISAELAEHYGIVDIDGRVIPSLRQERGAPIWNPV